MITSMSYICTQVPNIVSWRRLLHSFIQLPGWYDWNGMLFCIFTKNLAPLPCLFILIVHYDRHLHEVSFLIVYTQIQRICCVYFNSWGVHVTTFMRRCCVMASMAVICARIKADVKMRSTGILLILLPASIASSIPFLLRGTSTQPVNKFFSFHKDSPCRTRIRAASSEYESI